MTWIRETCRVSGWSVSSFITSRWKASRISSTYMVPPKVWLWVEIALNSRPRLWATNPAPYAGTPILAIMRANMIECRHSSAISVSAYWTWLLVGSRSKAWRSSICMRISSNQMPTLAIEATSCLESSMRSSSVIRSHRSVP